MDNSSKSAMPRLSCEDIRWRTIWMEKMLGYQMNEVAASLNMSLSFADPTTLIEIAVYYFFPVSDRHKILEKENSSYSNGSGT